MAAYLVISLITGFACAAISFLGFGVPLWAMGLFYLAGCWVGFIGAIGVVLILEHRRTPPVPRWGERSVMR